MFGSYILGLRMVCVSWSMCILIFVFRWVHDIEIGVGSSDVGIYVGIVIEIWDVHVGCDCTCCLYLCRDAFVWRLWFMFIEVG